MWVDTFADGMGASKSGVERRKEERLLSSLRESKEGDVARKGAVRVVTRMACFSRAFSGMPEGRQLMMASNGRRVVLLFFVGLAWRRLEGE
jgi:hypothetical protein